MEMKLQLSVFFLLIPGSIAVWQHVTVMKGQTLYLTCPLTDVHTTSVDWKNPEEYIMFFNSKKGLKDKRYRITRKSQSEFSISISNVTFKDGGIYTCSKYHPLTTEKKVEVTVLGLPTISVIRHDGKIAIKCSAAGNHHPPQISWKFNDEPEFFIHENVHLDGKKYVSMAILHILPDKKRATVKCLARHPALQKPLMNFVKIAQDRQRNLHTTTPTSTSSTPVQPQASTRLLGTRTTWIRHDVVESSNSTKINNDTIRETTSTANDVESSNSTKVDNDTIRETTSTADDVESSNSTKVDNDTIRETTSTAGWTSFSATTVDIYNITSGNMNKPQTGTPQNNFLILLVTFLIFCLLVVVIFFAIKLRRAHIIWKRENEDSVPSEESSKSKSSQEERNSQGQRRKGIFNTAFTKYDVEEPAVISCSQKKNAVTAEESIINECTSQSQTQTQAFSTSNIKETSL